MKITKVKVNYGRTVNMGNFESLRLDFGVEVEPEDKEEIHELFKALRKALRDKMNKAIKDEINSMV